MIGKVAGPPPNGGSPRGNIRYLLGYALGDKDDARAARRSYTAMMHEADAREDGGVGVVWSPGTGDSRRPSSIYAQGIVTLSTSDLEIQATAGANPRVREQTAHLIFSLGAGIERNDSEVMLGVWETLDRLGVGHHQYVAAIHRDTDSIHCHVALCTVDPVTYRAMNRYRLWERMDRAMRHVELRRGWENDRGLVVVQDRGLPTERIRMAENEELKMWGQERRGERTRRLERKGQRLDEPFKVRAGKTIGFRMQQRLDALRDLGETPSWSELHLVAARYGAEIVPVDPTASPPSGLVLVHRETGEAVPLAYALRDDLMDLGMFRDAEQAERDFIASVRSDISLVSRRIVASDSTFDRGHIVGYLDQRISNVSEVERLADRIEREDATLKIVSPDAHTPLYTTKAQDAIEERLHVHAVHLANATDPKFDHAALQEAMKRVEADLTREIGKGARLSEEQREMVSHLDRRLSTSIGDPGTGKTVGMRVVKAYGDLTGREIVGLTISQKAANRLGDEAGITVYNTAKGSQLEAIGERVIPVNGIVILDEAATYDSKTAERLLSICRERNSTAILVGDTKQLQPILAGQSQRIVRKGSVEAGTATTLTGVQRQRHDWHLSAVKDLADGLRAVEATGSIEGDAMRRAVATLDRNDVFKRSESLDSLMKDVARRYAVDRAAGVEAVYLASSRDTIRHGNEAIRERLELAGKGVEHVTRYGRREFSVGDSVVLRENSKRLGITNGEVFTVTGVTFNRLDLQGSDGTAFQINTRTYDAVDYSYIQSYHAAQGASVEKCVMIADRNASAELFFVGVSRSKSSLEILYHDGAFESVSEIADHISDHSTLKTTSRNFDEVLARSYGNDPVRRQIIADALEAESHPLRIKYEAMEAEKRAKRDIELQRCRERYDERRREIARDERLSLAERLQRTEVLAKERRLEASRIIQHHAPQQFGRFVHDEIQHHDLGRERQHERGRQRELMHERAIERGAEMQTYFRPWEDRKRGHGR